MSYLLLSSLSFLIGTLVGLTGVGGASLITPMLVFVFQVPPSVAISSDIVAATFMKIFGSVKHWQQKTIDGQVVKWLACGSVPGSLVGTVILHLLREKSSDGLDALLLYILGMMILTVTSIAIAQLLLLKLFPQLKLPSLPKFNLESNWGRFGAISIGAVLGCLVGLTSVSSGSMFALVLISLFQLDSRKLVGTDISQAAILLTSTSLGHLGLGTVNWSLVVAICLGSIPGIVLGAKLCQIVPQGLLRFGTYVILELVSWKLVFPV
jgi:uncharacterized membrane protein YfcA